MAFDAATGTAVLFGGTPDDGNTALNDTWTWDGTAWTQQIPATSPPGRYWAAMAYDSVHREVVLFGGVSAGSILGDTWTWDGTTWTQQSPAASPPARYLAAMAFDTATGSAVLFGGNTGGPYASDTWTWDGTNWTQQSPATSPPARQFPAIAYDSLRQQVVLFGGEGPTGTQLLGDTWTWDGTTWTRQSPATTPPARFGAAMAFDAATAQAVLFGGNEQQNGLGALLGDWWTWDGTVWTEQSPGNPSARWFGAMAYDGATSNTVLFGGFTGYSDIGGTWTWDGSSWTLKRPPTSPIPREQSAIAYDQVRQKIVLFGGFGGAGFLGDTWTWDGTAWTQQSPATSPTARYGASLVFDSATGTTVLFGGTDSGNQHLADTWTWDGTNWTQQSPATSPPARTNASIAYDAIDQQVDLFGGAGSGGYLGDTWTWDGSDWTQQSPATSPPARVYASMDSSPASGTTVLFGGYGPCGDSYGICGDTWTWDGTNWTQQSPVDSPSPRYGATMAFDPTGEEVLFGGFAEDPGGDGSTWTYALPPLFCPVSVAVSDTGYSPKNAQPVQGQRLCWSFSSTKSHSATDGIGLGSGGGPLFDSTPHTSGTYVYRFPAAGTYPYRSTVKGDSPSTFSGTVAVPIQVSPTLGTRATSFTVTWSSNTLSGYVFDVEYRFQKVGSKTWGPWIVWKSGVSQTSSTFTTTKVGTYDFNARLRNAASSKSSRWSPDVMITVTS